VVPRSTRSPTPACSRTGARATRSDCFSGWTGRVRHSRCGTCRPNQEARVSRDGSRLLLTVGDGGQSDIWSYDIARDALTRLTFYADNDRAGIWSPDNTHIVYASWQPDVGTFNLFLQRGAGGGEPQRLTTSKNLQSPINWDPDGKHILISEERRGTGSDLMLMPIEIGANGQAKVGPREELLATPASEMTATFSPDGKWLAYTSDESGRNEVYVRPFSGRGGRWQVSTDGAEWIEWHQADCITVSPKKS
jgi:eukaryotic-like serine/threonine-protein kinase